MIKGRVASVNISEKKGISKTQVPEITLIKELGVEGDAHAKPGDRQVSLLAMESIESQKMVLAAKEGAETHCPKGGDLLSPGAFAENITTEGLTLYTLPIGTKMSIGETRLEVSKIGKECHNYCAIYKKIGDCVMPREGIFVRVLRGGKIRPGDEIIVDANSDTDGK